MEEYPMKILVVDDEWSIRSLFEEVLMDAEYSVRSSENAEGALKTLKEENINVIFLDLKLFGMNGIELCRRRNVNPKLTPCDNLILTPSS
jgi:CheY-like chemotaxis protein